MKRGLFLICILVFGFTHAVEDNIGSEAQESSKTTGGNINFRFYDQNKRGAAKITNTDSPSFNHLSTTNSLGGNTVSASTGFKASTVSSNSPPFRYLYNQQYYQPNPFFTYVQLPQAAQIATQYSFQSNPIAHFLQTPNQIQYISTPTVAQVPQVKYQTFSSDFSANAGTSDSSSSSATNTQYIPQSQTSASSSLSGASSTAGASQTKQIQIPLYGGQAVQSIYYTQQPLLTYFQQPQASNFIYQHPNVNYLLRQQQIAGVLGANRFGLYATPSQNAQLTYLVPLVVSQPEQDSTTTTSNLKSSDKTLSNTQQSPSSNSFTFGTKA